MLPPEPTTFTLRAGTLLKQYSAEKPLVGRFSAQVPDSASILIGSEVGLTVQFCVTWEANFESNVCDSLEHAAREKLIITNTL
jgi:hypothetical protein